MGNNCVASTCIGCMLCGHGCNAEKIRNAFLFLPPQPSYTVEQVPNGSGSDERGKMVYVSDALRNLSFYQQAASCAEVHFLNTAIGERIPLVWVTPTGSGASSASYSPTKESGLVLLHCHGNATDIGIMMGPYFEMSKQLGVQVVGMEYTGYGASTGHPSCPGLYHDIEAAFNYVVSQGIPPERIVVYGQSVGSGPALHIAAKQNLGGVILHSGYLSAISVIDPRPESCCKPSCVFCSCDYYPNLKNIKKVKCPAFVMHGQCDDIVPFFHGAKLSDATPETYKWPGYFPTFGHNDLVDMDAATYFQHVSKFLRFVGGEQSVRSNEKPPVQIEMGEVLGVRESDRHKSDKTWEDGGDFALSYQEPMAGPEDGRYAAMRREKKNIEGGNARTLQPVPLVLNSSPSPNRGSGDFL